jgi:hypothetical protein
MTSKPRAVTASANRVCLSLACLLGGFILTGCGGRSGDQDGAGKGNVPSHAHLTGVVKLADGAPVPGGTVRLGWPEKIPGANQSSVREYAATGLDSQGVFSIGNLPLGTVRVVIDTNSLQLTPASSLNTLQGVPSELRGKLKAHQEAIGATDEIPICVILQPKYQTMDHTPLSADLKGGRNHVVFTVEKK